jgi:hypothetical protein
MATKKPASDAGKTPYRPTEPEQTALSVVDGCVAEDRAPRMRRLIFL